jgi:hypothetical protein
MRSAYLNFMKKLIIYTLAVAAASYVILYFLPDSYISPTLPYQFIFFFALTVLIHRILLKTMVNRSRNFVNIFMLLTFFKLMFLLTVVLVYIFLNREDAVQFTIAFLVLYFLFTGFEVVQSLKLARDINKNNIS